MKEGRDYARLAADFFGYEQYREKDIVRKFSLIEHPYWLPSSKLLSDYLTIFQDSLPEREDKKILDKAKKFLLDNPFT